MTKNRPQGTPGLGLTPPHAAQSATGTEPWFWSQQGMLCSCSAARQLVTSCYLICKLKLHLFWNNTWHRGTAAGARQCQSPPSRTLPPAWSPGLPVSAPSTRGRTLPEKGEEASVPLLGLRGRQCPSRALWPSVVARELLGSSGVKQTLSFTVSLSALLVMLFHNEFQMGFQGKG